MRALPAFASRIFTIASRRFRRRRNNTPPPQTTPEHVQSTITNSSHSLTLTSYVPTASQAQSQCAICLEALGTQPVSAGACLHPLHTKCIRQWMRQSSTQITCPICRHPLRTSEAYVTATSPGDAFPISPSTMSSSNPATVMSPALVRTLLREWIRPPLSIDNWMPPPPMHDCLYYDLLDHLTV